jgi:hypothetical protein
MKKFWWRGKQVSKKEFMDSLKVQTKNDLLRCHKCNKKFIQISKYEWKPDCKCMGDIIVGCG